jgi:hypothetical protein
MSEIDTHSPEERFRSPFQVTIERPQGWLTLALQAINTARRKNIVPKDTYETFVHIEDWHDNYTPLESLFLQSMTFHYLAGLINDFPYVRMRVHLNLSDDQLKQACWDAEQLALIMSGLTSMKLSIRQKTQPETTEIATSSLKSGTSIAWNFRKNRPVMSIGWTNLVNLGNISPNEFTQQTLLVQKMVKLVIATTHLAVEKPVPTGKWQIKLPQSS